MIHSAKIRLQSMPNAGLGGRISLRQMSTAVTSTSLVATDSQAAQNLRTRVKA